MLIAIKRCDFSLSAVLLFLFLAVTSYIVIAVNETNYTDNASDILNTDIDLAMPNITEIIVENLAENITSEINSTEEINETLLMNEALDINTTEELIISFNRDFSCQKCSNHKIPSASEFEMIITLNSPTDISGILVDYFPSDFLLIDPKDGIVTDYNESYKKIEWDVNGNEIFKTYTLKSPASTNPTSKYDFFSEFRNQKSDNWMAVVADPGIPEPECIIPDTIFNAGDIQINGDMAILDKNGLKITLRGVDKVKILPELKNNVLTISSSINIKNATIEMPHCGLNSVVPSPRLYIKEDSENDFKLAKPYCLNESCFNKVKVTPSSYVFDVQHFSSYTVNSTGSFKTLAACLKYINNTANDCTIIQSGYYDIHKWEINASENSFDKTNLVLAWEFDINHTANGLTPDGTGKDYNGTVNDATWNSTGYYGAGYDFNGSSYINRSAHIITGNNVTYGGWFKWGGSFVEDLNTGTIVSQLNSNYEGVSLLVYKFPFTLIYCDATDSILTGGYQLTDTNWHNAYCVRNTTDLALFVDGQRYGDWFPSTANASNDIEFRVGTGAAYFIGSIDQIRVYNRSLTPEEIEQLYAGDVAKYNLYSHGIKINSNNTILNLNDSTIAGDGGNEEYGIYYYRKGGNITLENCIIENFYHNYWLDSYGDSSDKGISVKNCTSKDGVSGDGFSYGNYTIQNFIGENIKGISLLKTYGLYDDIYLNCSGSIAGESCLFINQGGNNIFRRLNITTPSEPPAGLNSAVYLTDGGTGSGTSNNTIEDSYIKAPKIKAVSMYIYSNYNNLIRNTTIEDSGAGIEILLPSNSIVNNTLKNISRQAIIYKDSDVSGKEINITNNLIINAGNGTRATDFRMSYSPLTYNGINFTCVLLFNSAVSSQKIDEEDELITKLDGNDNATKLWLYTDNETSPVLGCGKSANVTLYAEAGFPYTCAQIATTYKGTCRLAYEDTPIWITNGVEANYTFNTSILDTAPVQTGFTTPPYLRLRNESWQEAFPVEVITGNNWANITGNTIEITDGRQNYYSMNITADTSYNANVWLNNFYSSLPVNNSGEVYFCDNGEGNFYEQSLNKSYIEDMLNDCGLANITNPVEGEDHSGTVNITWTRQSSQKNIDYSLFYSNNSGANYYYIDDTSSLIYLWTVPGMAGGTNVTVLLRPHDDIYNATNDKVSFFTPQIDVYNLSVVYSEGQSRIFKFKIKNIDTQTNSINYTSINTGEKDINSSQDVSLNAGKEIFTFVDYVYIGSGSFGITAYANSTVTDDEDNIGITV